jgi:hypothetical protein
MDEERPLLEKEGWNFISAEEFGEQFTDFDALV